MPAPGTIDPCSIDDTQPTNTEFESNAPGWWRYLESIFIKWTRTQHACDGKHFYGVDAGAVNAYEVEVGNASALVTLGLHAGLFVKFYVSITNTATSTLLIKSNGTDVGVLKTIRFAGANLLADTLVVDSVVEVVYDGTYWQLIGGYALAPNINATILSVIATASTGTITTLAQDVTSSTTLVDATDLNGTMLANTKYYFQFNLYLAFLSGGDFKLAITVPAGVAAFACQVASYKDNGDLKQTDSFISTTSPIALSEPNYGATMAQAPIQISGFISNGATAGDIQLQFAQRVSKTTATSLLAGSSIFFQKA